MFLPTPDIRVSRVCIFITAHGSDGFRKFPARRMRNGHPTEVTRMNTGYGVVISIVGQCGLPETTPRYARGSAGAAAWGIGTVEISAWTCHRRRFRDSGAFS
ncbi:hypothetical protein CJ177_09350 [Rhodococcus sp. ACPA1]|nr:hypothetical protein CJ177_09350 [Rhodococcus sp. ACPA1]